MSFDPNILGAFLTGSVLTYIARNKSYVEPEPEYDTYADAEYDTYADSDADADADAKVAEAADTDAKVAEAADTDAKVAKVADAKVADAADTEAADTEAADADTKVADAADAKVADAKDAKDAKVADAKDADAKVADAKDEEAADADAKNYQFKITKMPDKTPTESISYYDIPESEKVHNCFLLSLAYIVNPSDPNYYTNHLKKYEEKLDVDKAANDVKITEEAAAEKTEEESATASRIAEEKAEKEAAEEAEQKFNASKNYYKLKSAFDNLTVRQQYNNIQKIKEIESKQSNPDITVDNPTLKSIINVTQKVVSSKKKLDQAINAIKAYKNPQDPTKKLEYIENALITANELHNDATTQALFREAMLDDAHDTKKPEAEKAADKAAAEAAAAEKNITQLQQDRDKVIQNGR